MPLCASIPLHTTPTTPDRPAIGAFPPTTHTLHELRREIAVSLVLDLSPSIWSSFWTSTHRPPRLPPRRGLGNRRRRRIALHATLFPLQYPPALCGGPAPDLLRSHPTKESTHSGLIARTCWLNPIFLNPHPQRHRLLLRPRTFLAPARQSSGRSRKYPSILSPGSTPSACAPNLSLRIPTFSPFRVRRRRHRSAHLPSFATRASAATLNDPPNPSRLRTRANNTLRPAPFLFYRQGIFVYV